MNSANGGARASYSLALGRRIRRNNHIGSVCAEQTAPIAFTCFARNENRKSLATAWHHQKLELLGLADIQ